MRNMLGAMTLVLALVATAASDAKADDGRRGGFGFGFSFGDGDRGSFGFDSGHRDGGSFRFDSGRRHDGSFRFDSGRRDSFRPQACGRYEYRTETYLITPGGWQQVFVSDGCGCGHYETRYVAPVYGTRTVRVWVNR